LGQLVSRLAGSAWRRFKCTLACANHDHLPGASHRSARCLSLFLPAFGAW